MPVLQYEEPPQQLWQVCPIPPTALANQITVAHKSARNNCPCTDTISDQVGLKLEPDDDIDLKWRWSYGTVISPAERA